MGTQRRKLTEQERAERRARDRELTEQAVARLRCSAGWQAWLAVRARTGLRRYSLRNQLMIALQRATSHCLLGGGCLEHSVQRCARTPLCGRSPMPVGVDVGAPGRVVDRM